jgi:hypothetical protein
MRSFMRQNLKFFLILMGICYNSYINRKEVTYGSYIGTSPGIQAEA